MPRLLRHSALPFALAGGLASLLVTKPQFRFYPSLLGSAFQGHASAGLSLRANPPDISGLPPDYEGFAREVHDVCSSIQTLAPDGQGVAIVDHNDTLLCSMANTRPWSRYASLYRLALTQAALDRIRDELLARSPRYVVTRGQDAVRPPAWDFVWAPLYEVVTNHYVLHQTVGPYEIWQHFSQP